jgi:hypothetical protein
MREAHALNPYDSLPMMFAMESLKRFSPVPPIVGSPRPSAISNALQQHATGSIQIQRCQQQSQQQ